MARALADRDAAPPARQLNRPQRCRERARRRGFRGALRSVRRKAKPGGWRKSLSQDNERSDSNRCPFPPPHTPSRCHRQSGRRLRRAAPSRPGAADFSLIDGERGGFLFFETDKASRFPALNEPFTAKTDASTEILPVLPTDELRRDLPPARGARVPPADRAPAAVSADRAVLAIVPKGETAASPQLQHRSSGTGTEAGDGAGRDQHSADPRQSGRGPVR